MKHQSGFTLIELVMVIVILGILAATALPKFADLKQDARLASLEGLKGSMDSAIMIAHAVQLAKNLGIQSEVTLSGQGVSMVNGYPASGAAGIMNAIDLSSGRFTWVSTATNWAIAISGTTNCQVRYGEATATAPASTALVTSGC